jgi:hypothetical protein
MGRWLRWRESLHLNINDRFVMDIENVIVRNH